MAMEHVMLPPDAKASPEEMSEQSITLGKGQKFERKWRITPHSGDHKEIPEIAFDPERRQPVPTGSALPPL